MNKSIPQTTPILSCEHISKSFRDGNQSRAILTDINLTLMPGEHMAIVGASGSGKSTLLHILGGLDTPATGQVMLAGENLTQATPKQQGHLRNRYLGFVYQFHHLLPEFSVLENIGMPLRIAGKKNTLIKAKAMSLLQSIGLENRAQARIGTLSGGERQRVAFARALINDPICVLADEPTGNLDPKTAEHVYELMQTLSQSRQTSFIVVTHNHALASRMDRQLRLDQGVLQVCDRASE